MAKAGGGRKSGRRTPDAPKRARPKAKAAPKADPADKPARKRGGKTPAKKKPATPRKPKAAAKPAAARAKPARPRRSWRRRLAWAAALAAVWGFVIAGGVVAYLYLTLPSLEAATRLKRGPTAALLSADGSFVASYGELRGEMLGVEALPPHLPRAVIAIEDRRFYEHGGVDYWGVARAIFVNLTTGSLRQGASTISQQLARNLLLTHERSFARKAREALLAFELERRFAKDQILTIYLNRVYFGGGAYGVDAAARRFFGKPATKVNLWEAALLAGSLKAPSRLAPDRNPEAAAARARLVLRAMAEQGFIRKEDADEPMAVAASAATALDAPVAGDARYFADWALDQAEGFLAGLDRDVLVETTLDLAMQRAAERAVKEILGEKPPGPAWPGQAALVAITPDGAVRAMVGGRSYVKSQFNRSVQARRQMGSVFKPFVYLAAVEAGLEPGDQVLDSPVSVGSWRPRNFKDRYYGWVTAREALARSLNAPAVRLAEKYGRAGAIKAARRLGVASPLPEGPSVTLGAGAATLLELTGAYAALAAGGRFTPPHGLVEVKARTGETLYRPSHAATEAVSAAAAKRMNDMLASVVAWGSGKAAKLDGRDAAGKTGTSQRGRDGWFVGYTADLAVGVWVGNDDDSPIRGLTGGGPAARIWKAFMSALDDRFAPKPLPGLDGYAARPKKQRPAGDAAVGIGGAARPEAGAGAGEGPRRAPKPKPFVTYDYPKDTQEP